MPDEIQWPTKGLQAEAAKLRSGGSTLKRAVDDFDKIIDLVAKARDKIAQSPDAHTASMTLTSLLNPVRDGFDTVNTDLKEVTKLQRAFGKVLDKNLPSRPLPTETDAMVNYTDLIDRAILMHLLREGDSTVAKTFMQEAKPSCTIPKTLPSPPPLHNGIYGLHPTNGQYHPSADTSDSEDEGYGYRPHEPAPYHTTRHEHDDLSGASIHSPQMLQDKFAEMYALLDELKARNLEPTIQWAAAHSDELEARGSNLEFELVKLQYIWLFKGPRVNGLPDDRNNGVAGALRYANGHFARFQSRYSRDIQQLAGALPFASNLKESPYKTLFDTSTAFEDAAMALTRDFCSLLGLAAQSPLHAATVAGAVSLPQLIKYTTYMRAKKTEWTSSDELAYETPLPRSMIYHPIFVCPVLKVQTTDINPPMMLPCGHVICREALHSMCKGGSTRFKCPYCPIESSIKDAITIKF